MAEFNLRKFAEQLNQTLPVTADRNVLGKVALQTAFAGTGNSLEVKSLTARLDETTLKGNLSVAQFARPNIKFGMNIDDINADRYLPPAAEGKPVTPESAAAGAATERAVAR